MTEVVKVTIDDRELEVPKGMGLVETAEAARSDVAAVRTTIPSWATSVQPAWSFGSPSTSTRHMRHAPTGAPSLGS